MPGKDVDGGEGAISLKKPGLLVIRGDFGAVPGLTAGLAFVNFGNWAISRA